MELAIVFLFWNTHIVWYSSWQGWILYVRNDCHTSIKFHFKALIERAMMHLELSICCHHFEDQCHNKHHILYIVMNEITKLISHVSKGVTFCVRKPTSFCSVLLGSIFLNHYFMFSKSDELKGIFRFFDKLFNLFIRVNYLHFALFLFSSLSLGVFDF
jgi:hypothetical protein